jgi:hypothetical protein
MDLTECQRVRSTRYDRIQPAHMAQTVLDPHKKINYNDFTTLIALIMLQALNLIK